MVMTKEEIEEVLLELEKHRGRATELISVYIPAGQNIYTVANQLDAEKGTAKNIKSTSTRKNVTDSLEKLTRHMKNFKKTPDNGIALFCGNISKVEGLQDLQLWEVEPSQPLKTRIYRCDKEFVLEPLREILEITEVYGLLVMDRKEATIGMLEGKRIEMLQKMTSGVPSKVRAGGQCIFENAIVIEKKKGKIELKDVKVGDMLEGINFKTMKKTFNKCKKVWKTKKDNYIKLITKDDYSIITSLDHTFFVKVNNKIVEKKADSIIKGNILININLKESIVDKITIISKKIELVDIETECKNFFAEGILVHNSSQRFHRITEGLTKEFYKRIAEEMKKIFFDNEKVKGIIVGGPIPTKDEWVDGQYLATKLREKIIGVIDIGDSDESGLKELVEKSQEILSQQEIIKEKKLLEKFFETLGEKEDMVAYDYDRVKRALEAGAVDILLLSKKLNKETHNELVKLAENISSKIEIVSHDTEEGQQFWNMTKGVGAILRYRFE